MSTSSARRLKRRWLSVIGAIQSRSYAHASTSKQVLVTRDLLDSSLAQIDVSNKDDALWVALACIDIIQQRLEPLSSDSRLLGHVIDIGVRATSALPSVSDDDHVRQAVESLTDLQSMFLVWNKVYGDEADRFTSQWTDAPTPLGEGGEDEDETGAWADLAETTPSPIAPQSLRTSAIEFTLSTLEIQALQVALSGHCRQLLSFLRAVPTELQDEVRSMELKVTQALLTAIAARGDSIGEVASLDLLPRLLNNQEASVWSQLVAHEGQDDMTGAQLLEFYRAVVQMIEREFSRPDFALELTNWAASQVSGLVLDSRFVRLREDLDLLVRLVYRTSSPAYDTTLSRFRTLLVSASEPAARHSLAFQYLDGRTDTSALIVAFNYDVKQLLWVLAYRDNEANPSTNETTEQISLMYERQFLLFLADSKVPTLVRLLQSSEGDTSLDLDQAERIQLLLAVVLSKEGLDLPSENLLATVVNSLASAAIAPNATLDARSVHCLGSIVVPAHLRGSEQSCANAYNILSRSDPQDIFIYLKKVRSLQDTSQRLKHFVDEASVGRLAALEGDRTEQLTYVMRSVRSFSRSAAHVQQYGQLADILRTSVGPARAFDCLTEADVAKIVIESAARAGDSEIFEQVLRAESDGLLEPHEQEKIVLEAAEELYDNATSANLHQGDMKVAYELLSRVSLNDSQEVQRFKAFIEATSKLCAFRLPSELYAGGGSLLTPIEIRLSMDRLSLIRKLLDSREDAYKTTDMVLDIAQKLCSVPPGARQEASAKAVDLPTRLEVESRTLAMLTDAALAHSDYDRAQATCERLVANAVTLGKRVDQTNDSGDTRTVQLYNQLRGLAHRTSHQLSKQPDWNDSGAKLRWAGFALAFCAPEQLSQYLKAWRTISEEVDEQLRLNPPKAMLYDGAQSNRSNAIGRRIAATRGGSGPLGELGAALQARTGGLSAAGLAALSQLGGSMESYANPLGALLGRAPSAVRPLAGHRAPPDTTTQAALTHNNTTAASPISRAARLFDGLGASEQTTSSTPSEGQPGYMDPAERAARAARRFFHGLGAGF